MKHGYLYKLKGMIFNPLETIPALKKEKGMKEPFKFYFISLIIAAIISVIMAVVTGKIVAGEMSLAWVAIVNFLLVILMDLIVVFGISGLFHGLIRLLGGKKTYCQTFKAFAYITGLWIITSFIAGLNSLMQYIWILNFLLLIWIMVLISIGLKQYTEVTNGKLALVWVVAIIIVTLVYYAIAKVMAPYMVPAV